MRSVRLAPMSQNSRPALLSKVHSAAALSTTVSLASGEECSPDASDIVAAYTSPPRSA